jgi:hypothetical protein
LQTAKQFSQQFLLKRLLFLHRIFLKTSNFEMALVALGLGEIGRNLQLTRGPFSSSKEIMQAFPWHAHVCMHGSMEALWGQMLLSTGKGLSPQACILWLKYFPFLFAGSSYWFNS